MDAGDRISSLLDEMLDHVISFLPARDAMRTCMLSPRWHHLCVSVQLLNFDTMGFTSQRSSGAHPVQRSDPPAARCSAWRSGVQPPTNDCTVVVVPGHHQGGGTAIHLDHQ
ncbi:unnamed protein product [Urochloa humidicola]